MKDSLTIQEVKALRAKAQQEIKVILDKLRDDIELPIAIEFEEWAMIGGGGSYFSVKIEIRL